MGSSKGEIDFAIRRALNIFDQWNDCLSRKNREGA
jgi:hypothetical protein